MIVSGRVYSIRYLIEYPILLGMQAFMQAFMQTYYILSKLIFLKENSIFGQQ